MMVRLRGRRAGWRRREGPSAACTRLTAPRLAAALRAGPTPWRRRPSGLRPALLLLAVLLLLLLAVYPSGPRPALLLLAVLLLLLAVLLLLLLLPLDCRFRCCCCCCCCCCPWCPAAAAAALLTLGPALWGVDAGVGGE